MAQGFIIKHGLFSVKEPSTIEVYFCRFAVNAFTENTASELNIKLPDSLNKAVNKRKSEYLAGRFCADRLLRQSGIDAFFVNHDENRCPIWPEGVCGSITHNNNVALAAISTQQQVGIDIETIMRVDLVTNIQDSVLTAQENEQFLENKDEKQREFMFSVIFSAKESFFKAVYRDVRKYFDFACVSLETIAIPSNPVNPVGRLQFVVNENISPKYSRGRRFSGYFYNDFPDCIVTTVVI